MLSRSGKTTAIAAFVLLAVFTTFSFVAMRSTLKLTGFAPLSKDAEISLLEARIVKLEQRLASIGVIDNSSSAQQTLQPDDILSSCEDLMNTFPSYKDGAFLTRPNVQVVWKIRADESRELTLPHLCKLKRYTAVEARQCFKGRHLVTVGDSLSRYMALGFIYFLDHGKYPKRFKGPGQGKKCTHVDELGEEQCSGAEGNVCDRATIGNVDEFDVAIGGGREADKDGGIFGGRVECACARRTGLDELADNHRYVSPDWWGNGTASSQHEGRGASRVQVTYYNEQGWFNPPKPINVFNFTDCAWTASCKMDKKHHDENIARASKKDFDVVAPLQDLLNTSLPQWHPDADIVMYNRGLWNHMTTERTKLVMPQFRQWVGDGGRCFFRSTTQSSRSRERPNIQPLSERDRVSGETMKAGCEYLDFAHLTEELSFLNYVYPRPPPAEHGKYQNGLEQGEVFWDGIHYAPWVYEELNNVLLNVLCNAK